MCTPNTVIHMSRTIGTLRLGLYAPDTQVIPVAPIYYCNFDYGHISFSKFGLKGAMVDGAVGTEGREGVGLRRGLPP